MKNKSRAVPLALGLWCLHPTLDAQSSATAEAAAADGPPNVRQELIYLIRADARAQAPAPKPAPPPAAGAPGNIVTLDPYIVRESRTPDLPEPHLEAPLLRFFRTGTIFTDVGKKVTNSLYFTIKPSDVPASGSNSESFKSELGWRILF